MSIPALIASGTAPSSWAALAGRLARASDGRSLDDPQFGEWLDSCLAEGASTQAGTSDSPRTSLERWLNGRQSLPVGLDLRACSAAETIDRELGGPRYLVFADSPVDALCAWLQAGVESSPREALQRWVESVRAILRLIQRHGPRCLVLNVAEARRDPQALTDAANDWLGSPQLTLLEGLPLSTVVQDADPLTRVLAALLVQADGPARQLWQQLHACTYPLSADATTDADSELGFDLRRDIEAGPALARYRDLTASLQRLSSQLKNSKEESELLLLNLNQVQEELESLFLARKQDESALAASKAEVAKLSDELKARAPTGAEAHPATQAELDDLKHENELLLLQLHQVQEELVHYFLENRKLQGKGAPSAQVGLGEVALDALDIGKSQDQPPHRGLDLVARNLRCRQRKIGRLRLRLVEHFGRPGLAVFGPASSDETPFSAWTESGRESSQPFMLIIPSDHAARGLLMRLPRADWELLEGLVAEIARRLRGSERAGLAGWAAVAQRLQHQLGELPPRLRYDDLEVDVSGGGKDACIQARFRQALFGNRRFERIELRWQPTASPVLELLLPTGETLPPLSNWPVSEQGQPAPFWRLPVGAAGARAQKARDWASLSQGDRNLLLALFDALPAVPQRLPPGDSAAFSRQALDAQARRLLPEARRHALGMLRLTAERALRLLRQ